MSETKDKYAEVLRLGLMEGQSTRMISRTLSMARRTVRRILSRGVSDTSKREEAEPRPSMLDEYDADIRQLLEDTPSIKAPAVLERIRVKGYTGGVTILRDRLRQLRPRSKKAFLTLEFPPGQALQVDWADFGFAIPGSARRVSAFVMALAHSRYLYIEFTQSQRMGTFLRCMERGLSFMGGVTATEVFDNMKTVVTSRPGGKPVFNNRLSEYASARGFVPVACTPASGHEKGRVERPIGFIRTRFWPGRRFTDLMDLNRQASEWRDTEANRRVHEITGKIPSLVYENTEKKLLKPIPETPFDTDDIETVTITKTFRFTFDRNKYSVPHNLVGQALVIRANDEAVGAFLGPKEVARHRRCWGVGKDIEDPAHRRRAQEEKPRTKERSLPASLVSLGAVGQKYFDIFSAGHRSLDKEYVRITFLTELFGEASVASAMTEVMQTGHVGAEYVEYVMRHKHRLEPSPAPLRLGDPELDSISFREPDLSIYDELVASRVTLNPEES